MGLIGPAIANASKAPKSRKTNSRRREDNMFGSVSFRVILDDYCNCREKCSKKVKNGYTRDPALAKRMCRFDKK